MNKPRKNAKASTPAAPHIACICCGVWTPETTEDTILCDQCQTLADEVQHEQETMFDATILTAEPDANAFSADLREVWQETFSAKLKI
jgi:hypothetical protein